jgi:hypothetical protein
MTKVECGQCQGFTRLEAHDEECDGTCEHWEQAIKTKTAAEKVDIYSKQLGGIPFFADMSRNCSWFEVDNG